MKKTLVIHPDDRSTDFLKLIYEDKPDWTILNYCFMSSKKLKEIMKEYDRIIMMGHGTSNGLLNPRTYGYIIDYSFVDILRKKETISIWCHSDLFFKKYNIPGFHTGMIISEVAEASYVLGKTPLNKEETLENMETFARIINKCIDDTPENMKNFILKNYIFDDEVTQFNRQNIIVLKDDRIKFCKKVYDNGIITDFDNEGYEKNTYITYKTQNNYHKVDKNKFLKVIDKGNNKYILYSYVYVQDETFKQMIKDFLTEKYNDISNQLRLVEEKIKSI